MIQAEQDYLFVKANAVVKAVEQSGDYWTVEHAVNKRKLFVHKRFLRPREDEGAGQ